MWQSADPALDKYLPTGNRERDQDLPGMGGVFASPNLNLYAYSHQNPVKFSDPDGNMAQCAAGLATGPAAPVVVGGCVVISGAVLLKAALFTGSAVAAGYGLHVMSQNNDESESAKSASEAQEMVQSATAPPTPPEDPNQRETSQERTVSKTEDVTKGRSILNRQTDVTKGEFVQNLEKSGFTRSVSKDGTVTNLEKGGLRYSIRDTSKSTGGPSVDVFKNGEMVMKYRLLPD